MVNFDSPRICANRKCKKKHVPGTGSVIYTDLTFCCMDCFKQWFKDSFPDDPPWADKEPIDYGNL